MIAFARKPGAHRIVLIGALLAGLLLALALAGSPQLHELIHHDGDAEHHECLACTLQSGGYEAVVFVVVAMQPFDERCTSVPPRDAERGESFFLSCQPLEHAPPRSLLS